MDDCLQTIVEQLVTAQEKHDWDEVDIKIYQTGEGVLTITRAHETHEIGFATVREAADILTSGIKLREGE